MNISPYFELGDNKTEIKVNETGLYRVLCNVTTRGQNCNVELKIDGTVYTRARDGTNNNYAMLTSICELVRLTAGQKLSVGMTGSRWDNMLGNSLTLERVG